MNKERFMLPQPGQTVAKTVTVLQNYWPTTFKLTLGGELFVDA
jgi:hypothetical protein